MRPLVSCSYITSLCHITLLENLNMLLQVARRMLLELAANAQLFGDVGRVPEAARACGLLAVPELWQSKHVAAVVEDDTP